MIGGDFAKSPFNNNNGLDHEPVTLIDPRTFQGLPTPERQWVVPGWIPIDRATGLYGAGGAGKTTLMQMLCTAAAIRKPWLGLSVRPCRSILHYCEDDEKEMRIRQAAINEFYGCDYSDLGDMRWLPRLGHDNALMTFEGGRAHPTGFFEELLALAKDFGAQIVVEDTLSDVFAGDELNRTQARQFVQQCAGRTARELNGAVICCAHPSLTGMSTGSGGSGSTAWPNTFRSHLYLETPKPGKDDEGEPADTDERVLTRKKSNWARVGDTINMRWANGVYVADKEPTGILASIQNRSAEEVFLDLFDRAAAKKQTLSANVSAHNYAPRLFVRLTTKAERQKFTVHDLTLAMNRLMEAKPPVIVPEGYGRKSDPSYRLTRAVYK